MKIERRASNLQSKKAETFIIEVYCHNASDFRPLRYLFYFIADCLSRLISKSSDSDTVRSKAGFGDIRGFSMQGLT